MWYICIASVCITNIEGTQRFDRCLLFDKFVKFNVCIALKVIYRKMKYDSKRLSIIKMRDDTQAGRYRRRKHGISDQNERRVRERQSGRKELQRSFVTIRPIEMIDHVHCTWNIANNRVSMSIVNWLCHSKCWCWFTEQILTRPILNHRTDIDSTKSSPTKHESYE